MMVRVVRGGFSGFSEFFCRFFFSEDENMARTEIKYEPWEIVLITDSLFWFFLFSDELAIQGSQVVEEEKKEEGKETGGWDLLQPLKRRKLFHWDFFQSRLLIHFLRSTTPPHLQHTKKNLCQSGADTIRIESDFVIHIRRYQNRGT